MNKIKPGISCISKNTVYIYIYEYDYMNIYNLKIITKFYISFESKQSLD